MIDRLEPGNKTLHMKRLLLLRHAETSAPDRFHGAESDVGLGDPDGVGPSEVGVGVAGALAVTGVVVSVGEGEGTSAAPWAGPDGVRARAIEKTRATETAGYATMARTRARRALSLSEVITFRTP